MRALAACPRPPCSSSFYRNPPWLAQPRTRTRGRPPERASQSRPARREAAPSCASVGLHAVRIGRARARAGESAVGSWRCVVEPRAWSRRAARTHRLCVLRGCLRVARSQLLKPLRTPHLLTQLDLLALRHVVLRAHQAGVVGAVVHPECGRERARVLRIVGRRMRAAPCWAQQGAQRGGPPHAISPLRLSPIVHAVVLCHKVDLLHRSVSPPFPPPSGTAPRAVSFSQWGKRGTQSAVRRRSTRRPLERWRGPSACARRTGWT